MILAPIENAYDDFLLALNSYLGPRSYLAAFQRESRKRHDRRLPLATVFRTDDQTAVVGRQIETYGTG